MASCNGDCTTFNATSAKWFKLDAGGYDNGQWAAAKLMAGEFLTFVSVSIFSVLGN
jgi:hypothetical protein